MATLRRKTTDQHATMKYVNAGPALADGAELRIITNVGVNTQCVAGVAVGAIAAASTGEIDVKNIYSYTCGPATVFAPGDQVYFDEVTNLAVVGQAGLGGNAGYCVGTCERARAATDPEVVDVILNFGPEAGTRVP